MKKFGLLLCLSILCCAQAFAANSKIKNNTAIEKVKSEGGLADTSTLEALFKSESKDKMHINALKSQALNLAHKSVPVLIKVMKSSDFPEHKRWIATFMLGQVMGDKAAPFIAKFYGHPNWMMRLAALKTLLVLKQKKYVGLYAKALEDKALIVREQALENIRRLQISKAAPSVWNMLYEKSNYSGKDGKLQRNQIIGKIIRTLGDLEFNKASKPMLTMIKNKKFNDIFEDLEYSLSKILNKNAPKGAREVKRNYWTKVALSEAKI